MNKDDWDALMRPSEEPEIVALGGQTVDEVKDILNKSCTEAYLKRKKIEEENADLFTGYAGGVKKPKYCYESDLTNCGQVDIRRGDFPEFKKDMDIFAVYRKLAGVIVGDKDLEPSSVRETQDLMDYLVTVLDKKFPLLEISWSAGTWNPKLCVHGCPTQISMEKLALAHKGLSSILDKPSVHAVLADIVIKKFKELFI